MSEENNLDKLKPVILDVSALEAPYPLEKILESLSQMKTDEVLCVTHRHSPCSLFNILKARGYDYLEKTNQATNKIEITIWHTNNV